VEGRQVVLDYFTKVRYELYLLWRKCRVKFPKIAVIVFLLFLPHLSIFAYDFNNFLIHGQVWSKIDLTYKIIGNIVDEKAFVAQSEAGQTLYRVIAQEDTLTLMNITTGDIQTIPLSAQKISISKNYLFFVPASTPSIQRAQGFYILRLIDLYHFGFHSPIPFFFIPLDPELGHPQDVIAEHNPEDQKEKTLLLRSAQGIIKMEFQDIEDIIKAQLISLATQNGILGNQAQEIIQLIDRTRQEIESFYQDFQTELESIAGQDVSHLIPQEFRDLSLEKISEDDLSELLIKASDSQELQEIKLKYIKRFVNIITTFYDDFSEISKKVEFSFSLSNTLANTLTIGVEPEEEPVPQENNDDTPYALKWYAGITVGTVFITLILPKMLKKPFSKIGAQYSCWHYGKTSWMGYLINKIYPYAEASSTESRSVGAVLKKLIPEAQTTLAQYDATPAQFKRAFWQMGGDTATVIGTELVFRQWFRHVSDDPEEVKSAILIDEPFDENHSLWFQKNFLERVIGNQLLGTINTTVQLHILEKEYDLLLQHFVFDSNIEKTLAAQPRRRTGDVAFTKFNDEQRRQIAWMIHGDIKTIQEEVVAHSKNPDFEKSIVKLREKWLRHIQQTLESSGQTASLSVQARQEIEKVLDTKIRATYQIALEEHSNFTPQKAGVVRKCFLAFKKATIFSLSKVFGEKLANQSFRIWSGLNEPYFWNAVIIHHATRGSFNLTQFMYRRTTSLLFTTPFWLGTYQSLRNKGVINSLRREAMYGVAYGVVTNLTTHFIFVKVYEKYLLHTAYDIEFSLWELLGLKEKNKPKK